MLYCKWLRTSTHLGFVTFGVCSDSPRLFDNMKDVCDDSPCHFDDLTDVCINSQAVCRLSAAIRGDAVATWGMSPAIHKALSEPERSLRRFAKSFSQFDGRLWRSTRSFCNVIDVGGDSPARFHEMADACCDSRGHCHNLSGVRCDSQCHFHKIFDVWGESPCYFDDSPDVCGNSQKSSLLSPCRSDASSFSIMEGLTTIRFAS